MKTRICSIFLIILLAFQLVPVVSADTPVYMLLRHNNFTLGEGWVIASRAYTATYAGMLPSGSTYSYLSGGNVSYPPSTSEIYIPRDGVYYIWGLVWDSTSSSGSMAGRHALIGIDDTYDETKFGSSVPGFSWTKGSGVTQGGYLLEQGWHTVCVAVGKASTYVSAVMITDDPNLVLTRDTLYEDISMYEDTTAPAFGGEISLEYVSAEQQVVNFPAATDDSGMVVYNYYIDDVEVDVTDSGRYALDGLTPLTEFTAKVVASDCFGNRVELTKTGTASPLVVEGFEILNSNDEVVDDISDLVSSSDATLEINFKNQTTEGLPVLAGIALYTKSFDRMIANSIANSTASASSPGSVSTGLVLPAEFFENPQNYAVYAMFWDSSDNIAPYSIGMKIVNEEGN